MGLGRRLLGRWFRRGECDGWLVVVLDANADSTRVNYASNLAYIHGLETMVCMATSGAMQIDGGNWRIFAAMLKSSPSITTHLNTQVSQISKQDDGTYQLSFNDSVSTFDEVILAAPLQFTNLTITPAPKHTPDAIPYVKLHVTLFASPFKLDPTAFNLAPGTSVPQYVLTTLAPTETPLDGNPGSPGFYSISMHYTSTNPHATPPRQEYIYKIFSADPITPPFLSHILGHPIPDSQATGSDPNGAVTWLHRKTWHAYPREYPRVTFEATRLDGDDGSGGLWYTSGMESFISTMETSALSGKNIAKLVSNAWSARDFTAQRPAGDGAVRPALPELPLRESKEDEATQLPLGGDGVVLDSLGPLVVQKDGSLGRIADWAGLTQAERRNVVRVLGKRNKLRLEGLEGEGEKGKQGEL